MAYDVDGQEVITTAIRELVNQYPALATGDSIKFSVLDEDSGKAIFPISGSAIVSEQEDITGNTKQDCEYPFIVIYRAGGLTENRRAKIKEWLDNLGRWLEKQDVVINNTTYKLDGYPALSRGRKFTKILRSTTAYLDSVKDNGAENWAINITAQYEYNFKK